MRSEEEIALFGILFSAFLLGFQALFFALCPLGRSLDEFGADEFQFADLGSVSLAKCQARDAGIAAVALAELGSNGVKQLLDGSRRFKERSGRRRACNVSRLASVTMLSTSGFTAFALGTVVITKSWVITLVTRPFKSELRDPTSRFSLAVPTRCLIRNYSLLPFPSPAGNRERAPEAPRGGHGHRASYQATGPCRTESL